MPARAVVVRDTTVGNQTMDTAMVLQNVRPGGTNRRRETEGWAHLIVDENQRPAWQTRLVAEYSVYFHIHDSLPDHVLAEVLQGRITSLADAEAWWVETLAYAQGDDALDPGQHAVSFLVDEGFLTQKHDGDNTTLTITDLGRLTARMMVSTQAGSRLRRAPYRASRTDRPRCRRRRVDSRPVGRCPSTQYDPGTRQDPSRSRHRSQSRGTQLITHTAS